MAPSSALQLASPRRFQLSRPAAPSMSVVHPASDEEEDVDAQPGAIDAMTSSPRVMTKGRFMAMSSSRTAGSHWPVIPWRHSDGQERLGPVRGQVGVEGVDEQCQQTVVAHDERQLDDALAAELL